MLANIINFRAESKGFPHFLETLFHFSSWFSVLLGDFFLCFWGAFRELFGVFEELLGACPFGVSTERGLSHRCDSPLIFDFLVLLGALVFLVLLAQLR